MVFIISVSDTHRPRRDDFKLDDDEKGFDKGRLLGFSGTQAIVVQDSRTQLRTVDIDRVHLILTELPYLN